MSNAQKYAFDTEFTPDGAIVREAPKRISSEDLEVASAAAYERGKNDAVAQAERASAAALQALADAASAIIHRLDAESRSMREEAARIAMVAARKIADVAIEAHGEERAAAAIEAAMDALRHQPRLLVKLPPAIAEALKPRITEMTESHAYASAILVRAEPSLKAGEIVIDWSDGVIAMDPNETAERINTLIEAALAAAQPHS